MSNTGAKHGEYQCQDCGSTETKRAGTRYLSACTTCNDITTWERISDCSNDPPRVEPNRLDQIFDEVLVSDRQSARKRHIPVDGEPLCSSVLVNGGQWQVKSLEELNGSYAWCRHCRRKAVDYL